MNYKLACVKCGRIPPGKYSSQVCDKCGSILEVIYQKTYNQIPDSSRFWDYEEFLPSGRYRRFHVGGTRLTKAKGHDNLFLKMELDNPTGSFKDRGSVIEVAKAKEYGYRELAVASTGNMAYSISHYAKLEGLHTTVFIGKGSNPSKLRDIERTKDATIYRVSGDFNESLRLAQDYARRTGAFLAGDYCYRKEGQKTIAYELAAQLSEATHILVPVGNATMISGVFKGLQDIKKARGTAIPRLVAVQAQGCAPLVKSIRGNRKISYERPKTKADAIAVGFPTYGFQALIAVKKTKGTAVAVTEHDMQREQRAFKKNYRRSAELAGVASIAAFKKIKIGPDDVAIAIVSGGNV